MSRFVKAHNGEVHVAQHIHVDCVETYCGRVHYGALEDRGPATCRVCVAAQKRLRSKLQAARDRLLK